MSPKRRRGPLLGLLALSILLIALPAGLSQKARLAAMGVLRPIRNLGRSAAEFPRTLFSPRETLELEARIDHLNDRLVRQGGEIDRLRRELEGARGLRGRLKDARFRLLEADVVLPADSSPWRKSLAIALGASEGARKGMLVLHHEKLVGRVLEAGPSLSRVQLVTDPGFRAGAVAVPRGEADKPSPEPRRTGVYEGRGEDRGLLKWLGGDAPVPAGADVLTAEDPPNGVPRGLILGRVLAAPSAGAFPRAEVEPAVDFRALERVTLLAPPEEGP